MARTKHHDEFKEHIEWLNSNISGAAEEVSTRLKHAIVSLYNLVDSGAKKKSAAKPKKSKAAAPKKRGKLAVVKKASTKKASTKKAATKKTAAKKTKKTPKKASKSPAKKRAK